MIRGRLKHTRIYTSLTDTIHAADVNTHAGRNDAEVEAAATAHTRLMHCLAGAPPSRQSDVVLKLASLMHSRLGAVPGTPDDVEAAEFALIAGALADLVLLPVG